MRGDCRDEVARSRLLPGPSRRAGRRRYPGPPSPAFSAGEIKALLTEGPVAVVEDANL